MTLKNEAPDRQGPASASGSSVLACDEQNASRDRHSGEDGKQLAWFRVLEAVNEQRAALEWRIYAEDPEDRHLESDVQTFAELARALTAYLAARRASS